MEEMKVTKRVEPFIDSAEGKVLIKDIKKMSVLYNMALKEVKTKIEILNEDLASHNKYSPIEYVKTRLKTPESIIEKCIRKDYELSIDSIKDNVVDIAGVRIVCTFVNDIQKIVDTISQLEDIKVKKVKDYIKSPKPSGYSSMHMIVEVPVHLLSGKEFVQVEIQVRTIGMDFWASLEHKIKYKFDGTVPEYVKKDLFDCSKTVCDLDKKMLLLHEIVLGCSED